MFQRFVFIKYLLEVSFQKQLPTCWSYCTNSTKPLFSTTKVLLIGLCVIFLKFKVPCNLLEIRWKCWTQSVLCRSSRPEVLCKKGVLKNSIKSTGKDLCQSLFFNNFIKKETQAQVFLCEFYEFFRNTYFYRTPLVAASDFSKWYLFRMENLYRCCLELTYMVCTFSEMEASLTPSLGKFFYCDFNIWDALRNLVPFVKFKNVKNTHGGVFF